MKKQLFLSIVLSLCFIVPLPAAADQITIVADSWCPFNCEPGTNHQGYMIEIAQEAFKPAGHTIVYSTMPWKEAIEEARKGKYTAIVGAFKGDAPDFFFPEKPLGTSQSLFFVKRNSTWMYTGIDSLKKIKLGIIQDYSYNEDLDKYIAANKGKPAVVVAQGDLPLEDNINNLMKGKIDAFIEDPSVFTNYCGSKGLFNLKDIIKVAGACKEKENVYIAFSPANPKAKEYAKILSAGMDRLRKSGELKKILAKYFMKDWQ